MLTWHLNVNDNIWKIDDIQSSHVGGANKK